MRIDRALDPAERFFWLAGRLVLNLTYDAAKLPPRDAAQMTAGLRERLAAEAGP